MAADQVAEVTRTSWFGRIGNAFKGIVIGMVFICIAVVLLWWNEGRSVKRHRDLQDGRASVVSVQNDSVDPANESALVHVSGRVESISILSDPSFGVSANAIHLRRQVEMYQWTEDSKTTTRDKIGGGRESKTVYTYSRNWSSSVENSSDFREPTGHQNPNSFPYESRSWTADDVTLGAFNLSPDIVAQVTDFQPFTVSTTSNLAESVGTNVSIHNEGLYIGANPAAPQVGDLRVHFLVTAPGTFSIVARQLGSELSLFKNSKGRQLSLVTSGAATADEMFTAAEKQNSLVTWLIRGGGLLLMIIGWNLVFGPLAAIAYVLPILGRMVGAGTGLIAFLLSLSCSLVVIAIAWIAFRPLLGIGLLVLATGALISMFRLKKK